MSFLKENTFGWGQIRLLNGRGGRKKTLKRKKTEKDRKPGMKSMLSEVWLDWVTIFGTRGGLP